jgi:hypothetical protein
MDVVRVREVIVCILAACTVYACATGSTSPTGGGEGGEGGDSWGGPANGSTTSGSGSSGSGSSGSSSGSSGSTVCDTTSTDCPSCATCSREGIDGLCVTDYNNCVNDFDCYDFLSCLASCPSGDTACTDSCEITYAAGIPLFDTYASCVICNDCYVKCDGASVCM